MTIWPLELKFPQKRSTFLDSRCLQYCFPGHKQFPGNQSAQVPSQRGGGGGREGAVTVKECGRK